MSAPESSDYKVAFILETSDANEEHDIRIHCKSPTVDGPAKTTGLASRYIIFVLTLIGRRTSPTRRQRSILLTRTTGIPPLPALPTMLTWAPRPAGHKDLFKPRDEAAAEASTDKVAHTYLCQLHVQPGQPDQQSPAGRSAHLHNLRHSDAGPPLHGPCQETAAPLAAFAFTPRGQRCVVWRNCKVRRAAHASYAGCLCRLAGRVSPVPASPPSTRT